MSPPRVPRALPARQAEGAEGAEEERQAARNGADNEAEQEGEGAREDAGEEEAEHKPKPGGPGEKAGEDRGRRPGNRDVVDVGGESEGVEPVGAKQGEGEQRCKRKEEQVDDEAGDPRVLAAAWKKRKTDADRSRSRSPVSPPRRKTDASRMRSRSSDSPPRRRADASRPRSRSPFTPPRRRTDANRARSRSPVSPPRRRTDASRPRSCSPLSPPRRRTDAARPRSRSPVLPPRRRTDASRPRSRSPVSPPRRRRRESRSRSWDRARGVQDDRRHPVRGLPFFDVDRRRAEERVRQLEERERAGEGAVPRKPPVDPAEEQKVLSVMTKTGGAYIPPARLRLLQQEIKDKSSAEYQRLSWEALKKSLNGLINKVNTSNIKAIVPDIISENLIRGRGLFARSIMKAQAASLPFTPVYACLVAIINTKVPQIGELVLGRLIMQFRRAFKRNDKATCLAETAFIAHLCNQSVAHEIVALQLLALLLERPTDDSVEVAVGFMREVGAHLHEISPKAANAAFERFRAVLHEGQIDKRVQYMVEVLFQVRKDKFKDNPAVPPELDIVEEEDQIPHYVSLDDELDVQEGLNVFKFDPEYLQNEETYKAIKEEILGGSDKESGSEEESADEYDDENEAEGSSAQALQTQLAIHDKTNTNLINLRRTIYLTIMSSVDFEECCHKLMKLQIGEDQEIELANMIVECCGQEKTYFKFYGLIGERFCKLNRTWAECFEKSFVDHYETIHRVETNPLRNIAKYFAHLFATDALAWNVLGVIRLSEETTTASSRIFVKILFQELCEALGLVRLNERLKDPYMAPNYEGLFPRDNPKNTRFSINYFTSIGLGGLTQELRTHLQNMPKLLMTQKQDVGSSDSSSSSSSSSSESSSDSSSDESSSDSSSSSYRRRRRRHSARPRKH